MDKMYENIGGKIKALAKGAFVVEALASIITGFILMSEEDELYILLVLTGPIIAWLSSWLLYGFGELVEKSGVNARNTEEIASILKNRQIENVKTEKTQRNCNNSNNSNNSKSTSDSDNVARKMSEKAVNEDKSFSIVSGIVESYNGEDTNIIIPDGVWAIGTWSFAKHKKISSVTIPEGVELIRSWAFYGCAWLERVDIPESVTDICFNSFDGCDRLTIFAPTGSYAEQYAKEHNIKFEAK